MTLLIKVAGGRESVMVHLGRGNLIPERSGDRYPTELNLESLQIVPWGSPRRMQLSTDGRLYRIAHAGMRVSPRFSD
jgi:hypothetical protein